MKVRELMSRLSEMDTDAEVYLGIQPNYPWQCTLIDVVARGDFEEDESRGEADAQGGANDVFLVEGEQVAHLSQAAWRRR